jgi:GxxExxY protein
MRNDGGDADSFAIIGAAMEVHRQLGAGFLESVHHRSLAVEFDRRGIPAEREVSLTISYKGHDVGIFRADFVCFSTIVVELKAQAQLTGIDSAQVINYLRAARLPTGLLLNFGAPKLEYRRLANTPTDASSFSSA